MVRNFLIVSLLGVVFALTPSWVGATQPDFDSAGNPLGAHQPAAPANGDDRALGDVLNSFPEPPDAAFGLTFRNGNLWGAGEGSLVLSEMNPDTGAVISTVTVNGAGFSNVAGLGYDTSRNLFIVTDTVIDTVSTVDPTTGAVQNSWPAPAGGPVGASYDSVRDGYWICDFSSTLLYLVSPTDGAVVWTCPSLPAGSSTIAGVGYEAATDRLVYNSRSNGTTYIIEASDCSLVASFPTPGAWGNGVTVRPSDETIYLRDWANHLIVVVDSDGLLPVELQSLAVE
ncbi:MAG: hypothetical protein ABFS37_13300 [Acidobacteriota bacterium]